MTITADFSGGEKTVTTEPLYQWDTGQKLALSGLPATSTDIQVHFANAAMAQAIVKATATENSLPTCDIPNEFLQFGSAAKARAWVFYRTSNTEGYTVRTVLIPVTPRKRPNDYVSPEDPDSQGIVDRALELLEHYQSDLDAKEEKSNKKTTLTGNESSNDFYPTTKAVADALNTKVKYMILGENDDLPQEGDEKTDYYKLENNNYIHYRWIDNDYEIISGSSITVDDALSDSSENPVQNKVIAKEVGDLKSAFRLYDRILQYGVEPHVGGPQTMTESDDKKKVYYNNNTSASYYKNLMWYDDSEWKYAPNNLKVTDVSEYLYTTSIGGIDTKVETQKTLNGDLFDALYDTYMVFPVFERGTISLKGDYADSTNTIRTTIENINPCQYFSVDCENGYTYAIRFFDNNGDIITDATVNFRNGKSYFKAPSDAKKVGICLKSDTQIDVNAASNIYICMPNIKIDRIENQFSNDFYQGNLNGTTGEWESDSKTIYMFIDVVATKFQYLRIKCNDGYRFGLRFYDSNGYIRDKVVAFRLGEGKYAVPSSVIRIGVCMRSTNNITPTDANNISVYTSITAYGQWLDERAKRFETHLSLKQYGLPLLDNARKKIVQYNRTNKLLNFLFITDTHVMGNRGVDIERNSKNNMALFGLASNEKWADFAAHGGDLYTSYNLNNEEAAETIDDALRPLQTIAIPFYIAKGNHDTNGKAKTPVSAEEQANPDWNNTYYIKDPNGTYGYSEITEEEWSEQTLYKLDNAERITKSQWYMLAENHINAEFNQNDRYGGYYYIDFNSDNFRIIVVNVYDTEELEKPGLSREQTQWLCEEALDTNKNIIVIAHINSGLISQILKCFVNGTTYTRPAYEYSFDFSTYSNRRLVGMIHGHTHKDEYHNNDDFNAIGCDCGYCEPKDLMSINEYSFTIMSIDTTTETIYATRVGRGNDRSFSFGSRGNAQLT